MHAGVGPASIGKPEFEEIAQDTVQERALSQEELSLLYRIFDLDRSGFLELGELDEAHKQVHKPMQNDKKSRQ